ncbi:MAG: Ig-like domain repeat protein, partial [Terracidiphilus sp.]
TGVGGTSASTPAMAGIMALVNQKYGRQGQADFVLYPLRAQYPAAFHDVTHGSNSMPCEYSPTPSPDCISVASPISVTVSENGGSATVEEGQIGTGTTPEYNAVAGYNLATGLGTVDANVLVNDWNKVTFKSTSMTLTPSSTSFAHGTAVTVSGSVTTASGTPTGSVALMTDSTEPGEQGVGLTSVISNGSATGAQSTFALSGGSFSGSVSTLPGGTYDIWGSYGGDGTFGMTSSTPVQITVTPEASTLNLNIVAPESANGYFTAGSAPGNQVDYGTQMNLRALVAPSSKASQEQTCITTGGACPVYTAPTGVVKFVDGSTTINTAAINAEGDAEYNAPFAVGTHSITATYAGDNSYQASPAVTAIPFTVVKDTPTIELGVSAQDGNGDTLDGPNQPLVFSVVVLNGIQSDYGSSSGSYTSPVAAPTGTVTQTGFPTGVPTSSTLSAEVDPAFLGGTQAVAGVANFIVPAGTTVNSTYNVTFCYSGDSNYTALTGSNCSGYQIPIVNTNGSGVTSTTTATISTSTVSPNAGILVSGTVTGVSGHAAPTGLIYVYADGYYVNSAGFYSSSGITSSFSFQLNSQNLIQGANQITLQYTGDSVYNPSAFTLNSGNPISSPLSDFTLIPDTTIVPVSISSGAGNGTDSINVTSVNGFTGTVDLTCTATSPLTCTISPNPALTNQSSAASTLTINVPSGTANGNYNVLVTGKDAATSEFVHTLAITADVSGATPGFTLSNSGDISVAQGTGAGGTSTISATPSDGFTGTVNLSCAVTGPMGATSPVTCSIAPSVDITGSGAVTATLTATSTATTTAGNYTITVTGISGSITETTTVNVAVTVPGFTLINSGNISMAQGASGTSMITAMPSGGFTGTVNLSCAVTGPTGATSPVTCTVTPSVNITGASPQTATLTAASTATTTTGTYTITVTGTSGNLTEPPTPVTVTVTSAVAPSFALSNSGSISVSPGATSGNTSTISVTPSGGFTGTVNLTCAVTGPTGANDPPTCGFASSSVTISGTTAQMDVMTLSTTAASSSMNKPLKLFWPSTGGTVLAVVFFFVLPKRRRNWLVMILLLVGFVSGAAIGCGGGGGTTTTTIPGTTAGTYTVTVTGTSGNITMTTPVTLTVN